MNTKPPFQSASDESLEARIVAWTLGEASAFEAAELTKLCAERPELELFRRRMQTLHMLLGEAETAVPECGWKLPIAKRDGLTEVLGLREMNPPIVAIKSKDRRNFQRVLWAIAACLALGIFVFRQYPKTRLQNAESPVVKVDFLPSAGGGEAPQPDALTGGMGMGQADSSAAASTENASAGATAANGGNLAEEMGELAQLSLAQGKDEKFPSAQLRKSSAPLAAKEMDQAASGSVGNAKLAQVPRDQLAAANSNFKNRAPGQRRNANRQNANVADLAAAEPAMDKEMAPPTAAIAAEVAAPVLPLEINAADEPYSTFSLNVGDASFQIAKTALENGQQPAAAAIQVEQFYNAVDYGDPAPAAGEPITALIEQSAHPILPSQNLVRVSLKTAAAGRGLSQPLRLTLLVDLSGSMVREDRRVAMAAALKQLAGLLTANDHFNVIGFSRNPRLLAENLSGDQAANIAELVHQSASEGGTNLQEAITLAAELAGRHQAAAEQNRIVLFTDGAANLGNADPLSLAEQVKALRQKGIAFDIAGVGTEGVNDRLLGELARHGNGRYYLVNGEQGDRFAQQLAGAFRPAAENVKVQVKFNAERVSRYQLLGFARDRLQTEDFSNDAVDAAELASEEAGVAIYQVETLPGGSGELGEVSVRFRDPAKAEMVERKWTLPYQPNARPFDRASASMQLAGLSLLAAEKLAGGPLADTIDFRKLVNSQSIVRQNYQNSPRVADMLRVIEAAK